MGGKKYKIGFVASSVQLVNYAREISEELDYDNVKILQGIYSNYDRLERAIHSAQNQGYDVAIGGVSRSKIYPMW